MLLRRLASLLVPVCIALVPAVSVSAHGSWSASHCSLASRAGGRALPDLPKLDATGKVHGKLPDVKDLGRYDAEDLAALRGELQQSVQKRIEKNVQLGSDFGHAERQGAEQRLIHAITKRLEDR